jgi:hypothetical protein
MVSMFKLLCEFAIVSQYNEMNCNFVSRFFNIIFWSVDFDYMK